MRRGHPLFLLFHFPPDELSSHPVLALYSPSGPNYETVLTFFSFDASSYSLGAVLTQRQPNKGLFRPVVYLFHSLAGRHWTTLFKNRIEALAATWQNHLAEALGRSTGHFNNHLTTFIQRRKPTPPVLVRIL